MPEEKMVSEWALEWLEKQLQRGLSKNTEGSYRQWICKRIVPEFSDVTLAELTEEHVQHESIETTRIYLRRTASEQQALVDKIVTW